MKPVIKTTAGIIAAGAAGIIAVVAAQNPPTTPTPAQQVHTEWNSLGYKPHTVYQSRAAIVAAQTQCRLLRSGQSYNTVVDVALAAVNGDRAKATAITNTAITAYCPQYTTAEHT